MNDTITGHDGQIHKLRRVWYWHLTSATGSFLLHNARLGHGVCTSISAVRRAGLEHAATEYGALLNVEKENAWERVRQVVDPNLPTRQHALFLFDDKAAADRALQTWFPNQERHLIEARVVTTARTHRADSHWLDCQQPQWDENAERYWRGEMTADPLTEIVVDGAVYFPGWKDPPFGIGAGLLP
jgi:hypothetical protein